MKVNRIKKVLFDKFSNQLNLLIANNIIDINLKYEKTYICPICLCQFSEEDLIVNEEKNYLTLEDAPISILGGSKIALTCKKCNSSCGHNIDFHLKEYMVFEEFNQKIIGSKRKGTIEYKGKQINVEFSYDNNIDLNINLDLRYNNPVNTDSLINSYKTDRKIKLFPAKNIAESMKVTFAFLKTNYILTFSKFGYIFFLNNKYQIIRNQILNTDRKIFKYNFTFQIDNSKLPIGTYYVLDPGIESIINIFKLKTKKSEKHFITYMPLPINPIDKFVENLEKKKINGNVSMNITEYFESDNPLININILKDYL